MYVHVYAADIATSAADIATPAADIATPAAPGKEFIYVCTTLGVCC